MRGEVVAVDLETTGLDPNQDEIIEIGAVRVVDGEVTEEFSTLVQPGRTIPQLVTILTGISNDHVIGAPLIGSVLPQLQQFVGNAPLLGHNIAFDLGFLNKRGLFRGHGRIDTYDLASVLLPTTPRYGLSHLTALFSFEIENAHRALYDARATAFIYARLWERAMALPLITLREIVALSEGLTWDGRGFFVEVLETRLRNGEQDGPARPFPAFTAPAVPHAVLKRVTPPRTVDRAQVEAVFSSGGALERSLDGYEFRSGQLEMAHRVTSALNDGEHLMIEAGTGTGKSLAYLLPALLWAQENHARVVISTNTITLQDQLLHSDLPRLEAALGQPVSAAVLKGRGNYLCPVEFERARRMKPNSIDALRALAKTRVWLDETTTGDRAELSLRGSEEYQTWQAMSAAVTPCALDRCESIGSACPFYRARRDAERAHLVIVNHALLLADAAANGGVIPEYDSVIIDEAHHLEEAVTDSLARMIDESGFKRRIWELGDLRTGLLGAVVETIRTGASQKMADRFTSFVGDMSAVLKAMRAQITRLFDALRTLLADLKLSQDTNGSARLTPAIRARNEFSSVQLVWHEVSDYIDSLLGALDQLVEAGSRLELLRSANERALFTALAAARRGFADVRAYLDEFLSAPQHNTIYWLQVGQTHEYIALHAAPLHVGDVARAHLWESKRTVILTSATLRAGTDFKFARERLSADEVTAVEIPSPFDYTGSTLLYLPDDMPDPSDKAKYQQAVERALIELTDALDGRVLALFTSYAHLRQTAHAISPRLALGNIAVYDQSDGSSRQSLIDGFRTNERAILMGTRTFWEGIDLPNERLRAVVIVKLPFAVPSDPVFAARAETVTDSFNEFTVPDAIIPFRQGFGRLIRRTTDRGVVVVLDSRIIKKGYGQHFIDALPDPTVQRGRLSHLPDAAKQWIARGS